MKLVTIQNEKLTVTISTLGAEMQSVKEADGTERLWQGDPAYWSGRAPIMFPVCGGLKEDAYYLDGTRYEMGKHGFAKLKEWAVESAEADRAVFLLTEKQPGFPFDYEFRAIYALKGAELEITYTVRNTGDRTFWYSVGSHEAWATPGGLEKYTVEFAQPERLDCSVLDGNLITHEAVTLAEDAKELPLKTDYFLVDALVFQGLKSRSVTLKNSVNDKKIRVDYDGMDVLMLWTKPGADYICIEPWCNAPDYVDADMQIEHKPGCICLKPGQEEARTHRITFLQLEDSVAELKSGLQALEDLMKKLQGNS